MFQARILADSISPDGVRLTTFEATFPRIILAEVNTHRVLSRNSASSRAIPVKKAIKAVEEDPFVPDQFGRNKPGMTWDPEDVLPSTEEGSAYKAWMDAMKEAIFAAKRLEGLEVHKALANRVLEPYKWHTAIISGTEWSNFFALRTDKEAQEEFRTIALMMQEVMEASTPLELGWGNWHLPLVSYSEMWERAKLPTDCTGPVHIDWDFWKKIAVGRCARVSTLTHDGQRDLEKDLDLHDRLLTNGHLSPFEHIATPAPNAHDEKFYGNFKGWVQYRKWIPNESDFSKIKEIFA